MQYDVSILCIFTYRIKLFEFKLYHIRNPDSGLTEFSGINVSPGNGAPTLATYYQLLNVTQQVQRVHSGPRSPKFVESGGQAGPSSSSPSHKHHKHHFTHRRRLDIGQLKNSGSYQTEISKLFYSCQIEIFLSSRLCLYPHTLLALMYNGP